MSNETTRLFPTRQGEGAVRAGLELSDMFNTWLERNGPPGLFITCVTCKHMARSPAAAFCNKYNMTPPADVITKGCGPGYEDELDIPL